MKILLRVLERGMFVAGVLAVSVWLGSIAESAVFQAWQNWVFDRELSGQPASLGQFIREETQSFVTFATGAAGQFLGEEKQRLVAFVAHAANRQNVQGPVRDPAPANPTAPPPVHESVTAARTARDRSLVGRLRIPRLHLSVMIREGIGESTLRVALGHIPGTSLPGTLGNVGLAGHRDTLLRPLRLIQRNDLIRLETLRGTYTYRVESTQIVWPRNVSVLRVGQQPELTLVTCYPFYYVGAAPKRFVVRARQIAAPSHNNS